jgi:hypothetical protein
VFTGVESVQNHETDLDSRKGFTVAEIIMNQNRRENLGDWRHAAVLAASEIAVSDSSGGLFSAFAGD